MKKIFIALDTSKLSEVKKIIKNTHTNKIKFGYKFGLQFFNSKYGRQFISKLNRNKIVWLDLKLKDIPNTVSSSIYSLKDLKNLKYLTIHCSGGLEMMKKAKNAARKINKKLKILGVTVLTSFNANSIKKIGHTKNINKIVIQQAKLAKSAGLDGIVCSGREIKSIKKICRKMDIIIPGIRLKGDAKQDQKRISYPKDAFLSGATGIVIGRSITKGNIKKNVQKLIKSLQ
mgnify:FL=1|tara:strand:- start:133 stop:822 length:690 start_codon:yes stop_codon:yes gene_type:complete